MATFTVPKKTAPVQPETSPATETKLVKPDKNYIRFCKERDGIMIIGIKLPFKDVLYVVFQVILALFAIFVFFILAAEIVNAVILLIKGSKLF